MMNLSVLNTVVSTLNAVDFAGKDAVMEVLNHEVELASAAETRKAEQKSAKLAEYSNAHDVVMGVLADATAPLTLAELWDEVGGQLEGFTKGKLSYALSRLWVDEVEKTEGKVNSYAVKA